MADRQLYRSRNAVLGGVCAGIAERIDADAIVVRIFAVLLVCVTFGLAAIAYAVMWVRLPLEPEGPEPFEVMPENAESNMFGTIAYYEDGTVLRNKSLDQPTSGGIPIFARLAVAVGLMLLFLVVSINVSPLVPGTQWWQFWPLAFMIVGLCLMIVPMRSKFEALWHAIGIVITSAAALLLPIVLEIAPSGSISSAFATLWPLAVMSLVIFAIGIASRKGLVVVTGSVLFAMFCLLTLYLFALP